MQFWRIVYCHRECFQKEMDGFLGSWGSDTFAYCTGMLFGKHKAFPKLSPKKSVEGCIGGAVGAAILAVVYAIIVNQMYSDISVFIPGFALLGFLASVVSQIGDLAASAMKRNFGIKDYGKLIPGHGGVLDRFDSVIFTAPLLFTVWSVGYYYVVNFLYLLLFAANIL